MDQDFDSMQHTLQEAEHALQQAAKWAMGPGGCHLKWTKNSIPTSIGGGLDLSSVKLEEKSTSVSLFKIEA